jgi:hypothetical protein
MAKIYYIQKTLPPNEGNPMYKHGEASMRTVEYRTWRGMNQRCYSKTCKDYPRYGGKGVTVCQSWRNDYRNFLADMGRRPEGMNSIDRIDNEGNYSPDNCRWATHSQQCRNRRSSKRIKFNGKTHTLAGWSEITGIHADTIGYRIKQGWTIHDALTTPPRRSK